MQKYKRIIRENWAFCIVLLYILVTGVYLLIYRTDIFVQVHDNLDSAIPWRKMLKDNELFFSHNTNVPFLGGTNRDLLPSELKLHTILNIIFPIFSACCIEYYVRIIISIIGALLLSKVCLGSERDKYRNLAVLIGFLYGIMPYYPESSISFASLPLFLASTIYLYKNNNRLVLLFYLFYPMLSDFVLHGIFICGYLFLFFIIDWIIKRVPCWKILIAFALLCAGYMLFEYRLFMSMLFSNVESIRTSFIPSYLPFISCIKQSVKVLLNGHYHSATGQVFLIFPVCLLGIIYTCYKAVKDNNYHSLISEPLIWIFVLICINALFFGIDNWEPFKQTIKTLVPKLDGFSFARTLWFNCFLYCFAFGIVLWKILKRGNTIVPTILALTAIGISLIMPATYNSFRPNFLRVLGIINTNNLTWQEFYSEELFNKIKKDINYRDEWAIAFGFHPGILNYNGIATLDGYLSRYSQDYKEQFSLLIYPDLAVDDKNKEYFEGWGGRAYIFSNEIDFEPVRNFKKSANILIDPDVFTLMGGKYIFSRVEIQNKAELNFDLVGYYTDSLSPYTMYVYKNINFS